MKPGTDQLTDAEAIAILRADQLATMTPGEQQYQYAKWANMVDDPMSPEEQREHDELRQRRCDAVRDLGELVQLASNMGHTKEDQLAWALLTDMMRQRVERMVPRSLRRELDAIAEGAKRSKTPA